MFCPFFALAAENTTASNFTLPSVLFDNLNGLVEISALTTLIGSSAAASLVLGSRGPSGLAWATMSAFGMIAVVKACFCAATPGWLRETTGVRSSASDLAVGFQLNLGSDSHNAKRVRKTLDRPIAIQCQADIGNENLNVSSRVRFSKTTFYPNFLTRFIPQNNLGNDVYAYDFSTSAMIRAVAETESGKPTRIFAYAQYPFVRAHNKRVQVGAICLSFSKLIEAYILWRNDSAMLAIFTSTPWCYFLMSAIVAEVIELKRVRHPQTVPGTIDILTGSFPAFKQPGGNRKIIIGAAQNPKHALSWTIMWSLGSIICISSTVMTYLLLGKQSTAVILIWVEFQAVWMVIRLLVYHLIEPDDPVAHRQLVDQNLSSLSHDTKRRVLRLAMALSKYQIYSHPRGDHSYHFDCFTASDVPPFLARHAFAYPIDNANENMSSMQVSIKAVIGDTTLSSAMWISGSTSTSTDLYDSCVVVFNTNDKPSDTDSSLAIPAVRVLASTPLGQLPVPPDPEKAMTAQFIPKGNPNLGYGISWLYWIPLDSGYWLFMSTLEDSLDIRRIQVGCVMSDAEVTEKLAAGRWMIGISHVEDIKAALDMSRHGFGDLQKFVL